MKELVIENQSSTSVFWKDRKIMIIVDDRYKNHFEALLDSDLFSLSFVKYFQSNEDILMIDNSQLKINFWTKYCLKSFFLKMGIASDKYCDMVIYLGENYRMLRILERWCKNKDFIYIGRIKSDVSIIQFVPGDHPQNSDYSFINIFKNLTL